MDNRKRQTSNERGYNSRWRKARESFLRSNPLCVECGKIHKVTAAVIVDHITPHQNDQALFWDKNNWQSLCRSCHSKKTAREDGGFGNRQGKVKVSASCGVDGLPVDSKHHWNQ